MLYAKRQKAEVTPVDSRDRRAPPRVACSSRMVAPLSAEVKGLVGATLELDGTALPPLLRPHGPGR